MDLIKQTHPALTRYVGEDRVVLAEGDKVRAQKQVSGETLDILALQTVPAGKEWDVTIAVRITETDA